MPPVTDDEVGALLRETFAEKEKLIDQLPKATTRPVRRKAPALLAAAAVLAVLAGTIAIAGDTGGRQTLDSGGGKAEQSASMTPTPRPKTLSATASKVGLPLRPQLTSLAIAEIAKRERPKGGWPVVKVLDAAYGGAGSPTGPGPAGVPFTAPERSQIAASAGVPIEWVKKRPTGSNICDQQASPAPYITVGQLAFDKGHSTATIGMSMWRGCLDAHWLTYRLTRNPTTDAWRITGTVGPVAVS
ncbi:hypothetical protein [Kribbella sp. NPDC023855]|uniref:hypothetical protein n=1 Tax=Kribbella sp. NPDC023855 TaxID=3154698 RepID=UPI0033CC0039